MHEAIQNLGYRAAAFSWVVRSNLLSCYLVVTSQKSQKGTKVSRNDCWRMTIVWRVGGPGHCSEWYWTHGLHSKVAAELEGW